ncbi:MAG TPA: tetratricopeptide repeat protein [Xanthobacteraceae bacterium]|nr:tetratricopeptide repeat protein [Xanthobacteraceae bacterium]
MNRQQRRAAEAAAKRGGGPAPRAAALFAAGLAHHQAGRLAEAETHYREALAGQPDHADALHLLGVIASQIGRHDVAVDLIGRAIAHGGDHSHFHANLGLALAGLERFDEALASFERALAARADHAEALCHRGDTLRRLGRFDEALASYDQAVAARPDFAAAYSDRGNVLKTMRRFADALASYDRALALNPDFVGALSNRAVTLQALDRLDEALASCDRALALEPRAVEALINRAGVLQELRRFDAALSTYDRAIALAPQSAAAQANRALLLLLTGDFARGWPAYEWRRKLPGFDGRVFAEPAWSGEDIAGCRLLLHAEQGFGDTIQFARYAPLAAARGADVTLAVQPPLARLLAGLPGVAVIADRDPLPPFDRHCSLLSLPRVFATTLDTVPSGVPYIAAPADRVAAWAQRLPQDGLRIGLAWSGHPANTKDHERSIPFAPLAPLLAVPGTRFVSLQKDVRAAEADAFHQCGRILDLAGDLRDFADTAAVIAVLDLVITVDTAVAHLAGAMGKPVWVLLPRTPDFRWLMDRDSSPWYPSARLFRKVGADAWDAVIARVAAALARLGAK